MPWAENQREADIDPELAKRRIATAEVQKQKKAAYRRRQLPWES